MTELAEPKLVGPMGFVSDNNRSLRFYANYGRINAVAKRDTHPIQGIEKRVGYLDELRVFRRLTLTVGTFSLRLRRNMRMREASRSTMAVVFLGGYTFFNGILQRRSSERVVLRCQRLNGNLR